MSPNFSSVPNALVSWIIGLALSLRPEQHSARSPASITVYYSSLDISLPSGTTSVGFDYPVNQDEADITLMSGDTAIGASTVSKTGFIGFTSTVPITSLLLTNNAGSPPVLTIDIDNFSFGPIAAATPEPGYFLPISCASLVLLNMRRRATGS